jgi:hypothetical protein
MRDATQIVFRPEHVPKILFWLAPAESAEASLAQGAERGTYFHVADMLIRTKDGRELRLRCHDVGKNPVAFTPNGKDYYWGRSKGEQVRGFDGGVQLYVAVENAYEESQVKRPGP